MKQQRWYTCTLVKALAMLMVFLVHSVIMFADGSDPAMLYPCYGQYGVQLFLMVSGFLAAGSWERSSGRHRYLNYAAKRWVTIAVPYILAILVCQVHNAVLLRFTDPPLTLLWTSDLRKVLGNILLIHSLIPEMITSEPIGWFVGTLWILTLLYPLFDRLICKIGSKRWMLPLGLGIFVLVLPYILYHSEYYTALVTRYSPYTSVFSNNAFYYYSFIMQMPFYIGGAVLHGEIRRQKAGCSVGFVYRHQGQAREWKISIRVLCELTAAAVLIWASWRSFFSAFFTVAELFVPLAIVVYTLMRAGIERSGSVRKCAVLFRLNNAENQESFTFTGVGLVKLLLGLAGAWVAAHLLVDGNNFMVIKMLLAPVLFGAGAWLLFRLALEFELALKECGWDGKSGTLPFITRFAEQSYHFGLMHCFSVLTFAYYFNRLFDSVEPLAGLNMSARYLILLLPMFGLALLFTWGFQKLCAIFTRPLKRWIK